VTSIHYGLNILLVGGNNLQTDGVLQIAEAVRLSEGVQMLNLWENNVDELVREAVRIAFSNRTGMFSSLLYLIYHSSPACMYVSSRFSRTSMHTLLIKHYLCALHIAM